MTKDTDRTAYFNELMEILQGSFKDNIIETDDWNPLTEYVMSLIEITDEESFKLGYAEGYESANDNNKQRRKRTWKDDIVVDEDYG